MDLTAYLQGEKLTLIVWPMVIFAVSLAIGLLIRKLIFIRLAHWAAKTETKLDDIIIHALKRPLVIWCMMVSIYIALYASELPDGAVAIAGKALFALGTLSVMLALAAIAGGMIRTYSDKFGAALPITSLTQNIARIIIYSIGILIILNALGISIAPILATLGVGGIAVALALQDTLSNLFAGFYIIANKQIKVGDYIRLDSGQEGYVTDINWRTAKIRMLANNTVLVPNAKLTQAIITNYYLPDKELAVLVEVGVHYNSDLARVEQITCSVGEETMKSVSGGVPSFKPFIRYHTFGDFSIQMTVILRAQEFVDQYLIKHDFIKRLHERFKKEGIIIPYPIRAINSTQEQPHA